MAPHAGKEALAEGERAVVVLSARVAQKSYGTEKRFLCPPPTAVLEGSGWWSPAHTIGLNGNLILGWHPPRLSLSIPGDTENFGNGGPSAPPPPSSSSSSSAPNGGNASNHTTGGVVEWHGRVVSKHLYINEADEKRRRVVVQADIRAPDHLSLGLFPSRPVKVISKPSKKRQSVKNHELCLHHGSTISLFNRIRSQTVSTKYLGVDSGSHDPLPASATGPDGSGPLPMNGNPPPWHVPGNYAGSPDSGSRTCFVARTGGWDPFAIWIVDTAGGIDDPTYIPPPGYPSPPALARSPRRYVSLADGQVPESSLVPIHYNQLVVLQCLATGMVSPVMRVRKVDRSSTVVGGAHTGGILGGAASSSSSDPSSPNTPPFSMDARGMVEEEVLGDPVSQLHKVAFEGPWPGNPGPGAYLACLNDVVGVQAATEGSKKYVTPPSGVSASSGSKGAAANASMKAEGSGEAGGGSTGSSSPSPSSTTLGYCHQLYHSSLRKVNSVGNLSSSPGGGGGRDLSSSTPSYPSGGGGMAPNAGQLGAAWSEDVTDQAVWTIVGVDAIRYTFYHPSCAGESGLTIPRPTNPITPVP
ncbi:MAG: hypothetical protein DHS80DRAFT_12828, partial [Piptocephalis tieghemiana]